jgi:DMSO reductase anchor subunit
MALSIWFAFTTECALRHRRMAAFPSLVGHGHGGGDPFVVFTAFCGAPVLFCCAMVYVDTRRRFWRWTRTAPLFYGAALVLGLGASLSIRFNPLLAMMGAAAILLKLAFEAWSAGTDGPEGKTTRLLAGPLRRVCLGRVFLGIAGGALLPAMIAAGVAPAQMAWVALGLLLAGELAERYLFFRAVDVPKMPGVSPQRS